MGGWWLLIVFGFRALVRVFIVVRECGKTWRHLQETDEKVQALVTLVGTPPEAQLTADALFATTDMVLDLQLFALFALL
jgi:hypothetical protein